MTDIKKKSITKKIASPAKTIKKTEAIKTSIKAPANKTAKTTSLAAKKAVEPKVAATKAPTAEKAVEKVVKKEAPKAKKNTNATYATGKRKNAIAKVWLSKGTGKITINGKPANEYLKRAILDVVINQPFGITNTSEKFDINCSVCGGGLSGQAGAIKHGISIALQLLNPELRGSLKKAGFLTRDSRIVERKKAGLKGARKGQVFQKR